MSRKIVAFLSLLIFGFIFNSYAQVPVAAFSVSTTPTLLPDSFCSGLPITFADNSTNSPTGWSWNFNSTNNVNVTVTPAASVNQNPTATFSNSTNVSQNVTVTMTSSNSTGTSLNTATYTIVVLPPKPNAAITSIPAITCLDSTITFNSNTSSGYIAAWSWSFGANATPTTSTSSGSVPVVFSSNTSASVSLTVSNVCGSTQAIKNIIINTPPTASFTASSTTPCSNTQVAFTDASSGNATSWVWNFGNGDTSKHQNPVEIFTPGTYTVTLTAYNACGASQPYSISITVINCSPPVASFTTPKDTVCMNSPVKFTNTSTNGPNVLNWVFQGATPGGSNDTTPTVNFNAAGSFTVTLTVQNAYGTNTYTKTITVLTCLKPVASFDSWVSICAGSCTYFTNTSTEGPFTSVKWYFPHATPDSSILMNPTNICYAKSGTDSVILIMRNVFGYDTIVKPIIIMPSPHILTTDTCIYGGYQVELIAHGQGTITWTPSQSLSSPTGDTVLAMPLNQTTYTARDTTSCPSPDSITVCLKYKNAVITAPNTFIPDGKSQNQKFYIKYNVPINEYNIKIFNRWGEIVFKSSDYNEGWDGTYRDVPQNTGVYIYVIGYRDLGDNQYKFINGNVTLIR